MSQFSFLVLGKMDIIKKMSLVTKCFSDIQTNISFSTAFAKPYRSLFVIKEDCASSSLFLHEVIKTKQKKNDCYLRFFLKLLSGKLFGIVSLQKYFSTSP